MDFFTRQERSRRTARLLVAAFVLAFAAIVIATTAVAAFVLRLYGNGTAGGTAGFLDWSAANAGLLTAIAAASLAAMLLASLYRTASLSRGGGQVARMLGATEITADTSDLPRRRLLNVVEEMSIAAGLPVPEVYVLEQEPGINAFAAGLTPSDAAIAVTRGALERLDRAELQGVVAHEVSHIVNGDMSLNQRLIGLSFGILVLSLLGRAILRGSRFGGRRFGSRRGSAAGAALLIGAAISLIGAIGLLASRLIKAAVSRQRELLADASAVQFTREPSPLASALKKIGGYTARFSSVDGEEVAHMLFERGVRGFAGWFATHPPLVDRIRLLDPSFDGTFPVPITLDAPAGGGGAEPAAATGVAAGLAAPSAAAAAARGAPPSRAAAGVPHDAADSLLERAGDMQSPEVAAGLHEAVPANLYDAAHSRESVWLLVLALALSPQEDTRERQSAALEARLGPLRANRCAALRRDLDDLDPKLRIPLLELAMPALKQRPAEQIDFLVQLVAWLTELDGEQQLFDYVLLRMLRAYLEDLPESRSARRPRVRLAARDAVAALIASVAAHGHERSDEALAAYRAGIAAIGLRGAPREPDFESPAPRDFAALDSALERLRHVSPRHKRTVLAAVLATIRHDRRVDIDEIELFRAIAATLGCPVPPAAGVAPPMRCARSG